MHVYLTLINFYITRQLFVFYVHSDK